MLAADDLDAYLRRLGLEPESPAVDALGRLHRAHVERIPFETAWIHMGERRDVDPVASVRRIAHDGRGGYCFNLNGALSALLGALGYDVTLHMGGVYGPSGRGVDPLGNHLALVVHGLPTDANPGGDWYVDAGLGDALYEPMPLAAGESDQGPFRYGLAPVQGEIDGWDLTHDPKGSFAGMVFRSAPAAIEDFAAWNEHLSTSPDSGFVRTITFQRRDATGTDVVRGLVLRRIEHDVVAERTLDTPDEWFDAVADVFHLDLRRAGDEAALAALWQRVRATHDAWQVARPS
jgi:N-hydroxyarylamine O-acetyltransferase